MDLLFTLFDVRQPYWMGLLVVVPLILLMSIKPKFALFVLMLDIFLLEWLHSTFGLLPRPVVWVKDLVILVLLIKSLFQISEQKKWLRTPLDLVVVLLFILSLITTIGNEISATTSLLALRRHVRYIIFFYVLVHLDIEEAYLKKLFSWLLVIALVQVPVSIAEYFLWYPGIVSGLASGRFDFVTGTLPRGGSGLLSLFLLSMACLCLSFGMFKEKVRVFHWQANPFVLAAVLLVPLPLAMSRATFVFLPFVLGFLLLRWTWKTQRGLVRRKFLIAYLALFLGLIVLGSHATDYDLSAYLLNPQRAIAEQLTANSTEAGTQIGRFASLKLIYQLQHTDWFNLVFGFGTGSWSDNYFQAYSGKLWRWYSDLQAAKTSQIAYYLSELGIAGVVLLLILLFQLFRMNESFLKHCTDTYWSAVSYGFSGVIFLMSLALFYVPILDSDPTGFLLMTLSAMVFSAQNRSVTSIKKRVIVA